MKLETQRKRAQAECDKFNAKYPVGITMHLQDDFGELHLVQIYAPASVISCQACGWATSDTKHWGSYLLDRFKQIDRFKPIKLTPLKSN